MWPEKLQLGGNCCCCYLVAESCLTLCDPTDCSLPGSSVHGSPQARILEWVVISFSRESSWPRDRTQVFCLAGKFFFTTEWPGKPKKKTITLLISVSCVNYKGIFSNVHAPCRLSFLISFLQFPYFVPFPPLCFLSSLFPLSWISFLLLSFFSSLTWYCGKKQRWLRTNLACLMANPQTSNCNTAYPVRILPSSV